MFGALVETWSEDWSARQCFFASSLPHLDDSPPPPTSPPPSPNPSTSSSPPAFTLLRKFLLPLPCLVVAPEKSELSQSSSLSRPQDKRAPSHMPRRLARSSAPLNWLIASQKKTKKNTHTVATLPFAVVCANMEHIKGAYSLTPSPQPHQALHPVPRIPPQPPPPPTLLLPSFARCTFFIFYFFAD